jgi:hypothetical protein
LRSAPPVANGVVGATVLPPRGGSKDEDTLLVLAMIYSFDNFGESGTCVPFLTGSALA